MRLRWLGTPEFTWTDLRAIVKHSRTDSALVRVLDPDTARWGVVEQLLAEAVDTLHWLQWSKTKGAQSRPPRDMPEPIPRPGVKPSTETIKFDVMGFDETLEWLGWDQPTSLN